jgi:hypothetical protein
MGGRFFLFLVLPLAACSSTPHVYGPVVDGGAEAEAGPEPMDAAVDMGVMDVAAMDAPPDGPSCTSTLALIAGSSTSLFTAGGPALSALTATSGSGNLLDCGNDFGCANPVAIARVGTSLLAVIAGSSGALSSSTYATSWQTPAAIGTTTTIDGPALAVVGTTGHLVYQGTDYKYYHGQYTTSWDAASDPVGGSGSSQSYGARAPGAAGAGTSLVIVQAGSNSYLYDQTWSGTWQAAVEQGGAAVQNTLPPTLVPMSGGTSDLLAAYLRNGDYKVMAVNRASGVWATTPTLVDMNAYSNDPVALAPLPGGKALLVYRGSDQAPYWTMWDGVSTWTAPVAVLGTSNPMITAVPSITPGVCGVDAFVAFVENGGGVTLVPFTAGVFGTPATVSGTTGAKFVAVATFP